MTEDDMKFQRVNVYNRHLPYKDVLDADADAYFAQVSSQLTIMLTAYVQYMGSF